MKSKILKPVLSSNTLSLQKIIKCLLKMAKILNGANKDRKNKAQMDLTQETSEYL
ncbi:hypothetical protein VN1210_01240 [Helicobacter pylori]|nr:hypothetical protein VN1210_01240 [Helicobacter pylori]